MIRYHGSHDWVLDPTKSIDDWKERNQNHTHVNNESHLKLIEEDGMAHEYSPGT